MEEFQKLKGKVCAVAGGLDVNTGGEGAEREGHPTIYFALLRFLPRAVLSPYGTRDLGASSLSEVTVVSRPPQPRGTRDFRMHFSPGGLEVLMVSGFQIQRDFFLPCLAVKQPV